MAWISIGNCRFGGMRRAGVPVLFKDREEVSQVKKQQEVPLPLPYLFVWMSLTSGGQSALLSLDVNFMHNYSRIYTLIFDQMSKYPIVSWTPEFNHHTIWMMNTTEKIVWQWFFKDTGHEVTRRVISERWQTNPTDSVTTLPHQLGGACRSARGKKVELGVWGGQADIPRVSQVLGKWNRHCSQITWSCREPREIQKDVRKEKDQRTQISCVAISHKTGKGESSSICSSISWNKIYWN